MAAKKVLITGANGLLGTTLAPVLRQKGHDIITHGLSGDVQHQGDLTDPVVVASLLDAVVPDVIVNLVALTDVDECERDPQRAYQLNVRVVENIAAWIGVARRAALVHISTDQIYEGPGQHTEDDVVMTNTYGLSKYASEWVASSVDGVSLRTNFFGRSRAAGRQSLSDWLEQTLRSGQPATVFEDVSFSPLALPTLCEAIATVVAAPVAGNYNLGSRGGMTKAAFAFKLAEVLGLDASNLTGGLSTEKNLAAKRPSGMILDSSKFETVYGVVLPTTQEEIERLKNDGDD